MKYDKKYTTVNYLAICPDREVILKVSTLKEARKLVKSTYPDAEYILRQTVRGMLIREKSFKI